MQRRYTGPSAETVARCLPRSSNRPDHDGGWRLRGYCHGHGDKRDSASLTVQDRQDGGITVHCFAGCQRREIITALEQATGLMIWDAWDSPGQAQMPVYHVNPGAQSTAGMPQSLVPVPPFPPATC